MHGQSGYVTVPFLTTAGLTMILLVMFTNVLAVHYARGVMQSAVEQGARQGTAVGTTSACTDRTQAVIESGLGAMAVGVGPPLCSVDPGRTVVLLDATFTPWLPGLPLQTASVRAVVTTAEQQ